MRLICTFTFLALTALAILPTTALAGDNPEFTLPLHAKLAASAPCNGYLPVNCLNVPPTVNVPESTDLVIWLFVSNYYQITGVQTAFAWDASWTFDAGLWNCQANQTIAVAPGPPGGPVSGTIATVFSCVTGPAIAPIGRLMMTSGTQGCLYQVGSSYPFGNHVVDCQNGMDARLPETDPWRFGRICVGQGGFDACWPNPAVEPATWGAVKATYE